MYQNTNSPYESTPENTGIIETLFPKVLANHVSKLDGFEGMQYADVLDIFSNPTESLEDRVVRAARQVGQIGLQDQLIHEAGILRLVMDGRESEVDDSERIANYVRSDANQIAHGSSPKNLDYYIRYGIEIDFTAEDRAKAGKQCQIDSRKVPLIEKLKAQRLLGINGFAESRVMYAVHDMVDHVWLFREMRDAGIMDRYADFLQSIDMGQSAFLYSRQAELFASVGFGSRRWKVAQQQGEKPLIEIPMIQGILLASEDERCHQASGVINEMDPSEQQQAIFMIENMAVQFADERRRWGAVKVEDATTDTRRPIDLFEPLHLSMMIESLRLLQVSRKFNTAQLAATVGIEAILEEALHDSGSESRIIVPVSFEPVIHRDISDDKLAWIRNNLSVTTSYNRID